MGNVFHCCRTLSNYFKCEDTLAPGGAEQSPLLSSEDSECDSPSLPHSSEDDLLTVSDGITNPTLEPENFLFPDIILSSNPGGEVTLVEPMVCLLVSEEGEEDERGYEGQARSSMGRDRDYSEVETQTEVETQIGMGVQTQTESQAEVQTQTEILKCNTETVEEEIHTLTNAVVRKEMDDLEQRQKLLEIHFKQEQEKKSIKSETCAGMDTCLSEETSTSMNQIIQREQDTDLQRENVHTRQEGVVMAQESSDLPTQAHLHEKNQQQNPESQAATGMWTEHKASSMGVVGSHKMKQHSQTNTGKNFKSAGCCKDLNMQINQNDEHEMSVLSCQTLDIKDYDIHTDVTLLNVDHTPYQDNSELENREQEGDTTALQHALERAAMQVEDEEEAEKQQTTLLLVDRLFLVAPHVKEPSSQAVDNLNDGLPQPSNDDDRKQPSLADIVELNETSFTVRIQPPGTESFQLQVSEQMLVAELHQMLMDHEITCHRTCFSLQLGGITLDSLTELRSIQGIQDRALIKLVEESYSVRDVRLHLRHVRDLLRSLDPADAYNGVNGCSLSYVSLYTGRHKDGETVGKSRASEKVSVDDSPPEYILPGCKELPLHPLQPIKDDGKPLQCLRVLTTSSWNPPPGNRKMHGDLMYINVLTMEDKELNITASTRGFYLNQSTAFKFNPKPAVPKNLCHSLVVLLSQVSPAFKKNFNVLQRRRVQQHLYERIAAPFQVFTWIAPQGDHTLDCVRAEETHTSRMGQDEHTAGQSRDWNEELQGCRELPRNSLQQRLHRERSMFKTNSGFVAAAAQGAVAVVDGNIMPLNPGEPPHLQMFMWNNLFFSQGFDMSEHNIPLGGNTAAHAGAVCDLRGAEAYMSVDTEGLHTLGTAVVDYRGIRVIAQTIVPGILEKNHEQIVYGSNDNGKTVFTHPRFLELLDKTSKPLRIQRHRVLDHNDRPVELCSGISTVGIFGNDGRPYILDLMRTFPPDLNFQLSETEEISEEVPNQCQSLSYPLLHRHSLARLRPELIEAFLQHRHELFLKLVSQELSQPKNPDKATEELACELRDGDGAACSEDTEFQRRNAIMKACKSVGSVSDSCFDIRFNPDVQSPGVRFPSECNAELQSHRRLLWDAAAFLLSNQIPAVLKDCLDQTVMPMDGETLTSVLHQRGVNVRYLGTILEQMEEEERLCHIKRISTCEIIIRSAKHIFRSFLQDVEPAAFSAAVSHFLNCLLTSSYCFSDSCSDELLPHRRSRRRRSHGSRVSLMAGSVWAKLTSAELWRRIRVEAQDYYHYTIISECIDEEIEKHNLRKISLLREMAIKTGIQVQLREYAIESRHKPVFGEEDVVNMFPVVKHLRPTSTDATLLVQEAQQAVQQGLLRDGLNFINQALTLFSSVCGLLHEDVGMCLRLLGRLCYILGENEDALSYQEKAVMSSERIKGIDHPQTIQDYTHLALYCFAGGCHSASLQLLYRARYLTLLVSGDDHPHVALLDSMLGLILYGLMEYELSLKFLQNALTLNSKYHGTKSLKCAHSHHLLATVYESKGDFRLALQCEKEAYSIYKSQVGEEHNNTKESSEYLKSLTQQAVTLQKAINQIYSAGIPAPKFSPPSLLSVLQQLNLTCGILFIPLSAKELADLRTEREGKEKVEIEELDIDY